MALDSPHAGTDRRSVLRCAGLAALGALAAGCASPAGRTGSRKPVLAQWYRADGGAGAGRAAARYAAAYRKARIAVRWTSGDYSATLAAALLSRQPPDIFENQLNDDLVRSGQIVPLDDLLGGVRSDFAAVDLAATTVGGSVYGIPMVEDVQLLYYRRSMLDKAGVAPPATVDELIDAAKTLTTPKRKGLFVGNDGGVAALGGPALWSAGLSYVTPERAVGFDDPRAATSVAKLRTLYTSNALLLGASADWTDPTAFIAGQVAMQWTGLSAMPVITAALGDDVAVAAFPPLDRRGAPSVPVSTSAAMVDAKGQDTDAAKAFVKWLWIDQTAYQEDFALGHGLRLPPRKSVAGRSAALASGPPADALRLSRTYGVPAAPPEWSPAMSVAYADALTNVVQHGADARSELATVAATVRRGLTRASG